VYNRVQVKGASRRRKSSGDRLFPSPYCTTWSISPSSVSLAPNSTAKAILTVYAGTVPSCPSYAYMESGCNVGETDVMITDAIRELLWEIVAEYCIVRTLYL